MKRIFKRNVVAAAVLGAIALSGTALAVDEVEPNHPIQMAQQLIIPAGGSVTINGVVGVLPPGTPIQDVDFYSFNGKAGDVVTINIDGAFLPGVGGVNTWIAIFGPGPSFTMKASNGDATSIDAGSPTKLDSRIDNFRLDTDGVWTVGVTGLKRQLTDGGTFEPGFLTVDPFRGSGRYTLIISGVTPSVQQISIDVKPGSGRDPSPVNPKSKGTIPVALLSSAEFNALDVKTDVKSLKFGRTGNEESLRKCNDKGEDVNGDGRLDLVCHFENQLAKFIEEDDRGTVRGVTKAGLPFEGHGMLKVIPVTRDE
jgi:hypothetical protein